MTTVVAAGTPMLEGFLGRPCPGCTMWGTNERGLRDEATKQVCKRLKTSYFCRNDTAAPQCPKHGTTAMQRPPKDGESDPPTGSNVNQKVISGFTILVPVCR